MNDRYTKTVLTIIALALCFDVAERAVKPAYAAPAAAPALTRVAICDPDSPKLCARILTMEKQTYNPFTSAVEKETRTGVGVFQQ